MLSVGLVIKGKWKISRKIGQGAFGEIYQSKNVLTGEDVALKIEKVDTKKQVLKLEVAVLKKLQECPYVCRFITCGRYADYNYLAMELLGENLSELRRKQTDGIFSLNTTLKLGEQLLRVIQSMHDLGYLHRDIKPSNFAMGLGQKKRIVFVIDFGLSRRYLLPEGEVRPPRDSTGFRGTARYASVYSHQAQDLGRRDDLWSLFYVLVEFAKGSLPWRKLKEKDQIGEMKQKTTNEELTSDLPPEFLSFAKHLQGLEFESRPDYDMLQGLISAMMSRTEQKEKAPFDWEIAGGYGSDPPSHLAVTSAGTTSQLSTGAKPHRPYSGRLSGSHLSPKSSRMMDSRNGSGQGEYNNDNYRDRDKLTDGSFSESGRQIRAYQPTYNTSDAPTRDKTPGGSILRIQPDEKAPGNGRSDDTASESEDHSSVEKTKDDIFLTPPMNRKNQSGGSMRSKAPQNGAQRMQPLNILEQKEEKPPIVTTQNSVRTNQTEALKTNETPSTTQPATVITVTETAPTVTTTQAPPKRNPPSTREREKSGGCCVVQ